MIDKLWNLLVHKVIITYVATYVYNFMSTCRMIDLQSTFLAHVHWCTCIENLLFTDYC